MSRARRVIDLRPISSSDTSMCECVRGNVQSCSTLHAQQQHVAVIGYVNSLYTNIAICVDIVVVQFEIGAAECHSPYDCSKWLVVQSQT